MKNSKVRKNWAGNYAYKATNLHEPTTVEEVQALLKKTGQQKALGSKHCFNNIADSLANQVSTRLLNKIVSINKEEKTITLEAGVRYGDFAEKLDRQGLALHNLASLPHITVVGACATATHGSGKSLGNLATSILAMELVTSQGEVVTLNRSHPDFYGAVVGLGAIGIITKITLQAEDTYQIRQDVFQDLPLESLKNHFEEIMGSGYSVSLFTDWLGQKISQVWIKRRMDSPVPELGNEFFGARAATHHLHPIADISPENCTEQLGIPGPWYDRLPHFKMGFMPSGGEELQSEYFISRDHAVDAILALEKKKALINPHLLITEIRTIAADQCWMSPCFQQDSVAIHFTWKQNWKAVQQLLPMIEAELAPYAPRPHWGKLFTLDPATLQQRYEKFPDFLAMIRKYDPEGKFRNAFLDRNVYGEES